MKWIASRNCPRPSMLRESPVRMNRCDAIRVAGKMGFGAGGVTTVAEAVASGVGAANLVGGKVAVGVAVDVSSGVGVSSGAAAGVGVTADLASEVPWGANGADSVVGVGSMMYVVVTVG